MLTPQSRIQSFLDDQIACGKETGLQVAAYHSWGHRRPHRNKRASGIAVVPSPV